MNNYSSSESFNVPLLISNMHGVERIRTDMSSLGLAPAPPQQRIPGKYILLNRPDTFRVRFISSGLIAVAASCGAVGSVLALGDAGISFDTLKTTGQYYGLACAAFAASLSCYSGRVTVDAVSGFITLRGHKLMGNLRKNVHAYPLSDMQLVKELQRFYILKFPGQSLPLPRFWLLPKRSAFATRKQMFMQPEPIPINQDLAAKPRGVYKKVNVSSALEKYVISKDGCSATPQDDLRISAFLKCPAK